MYKMEVPIIRRLEGPREMGVPDTMIAGPPAEKVVPSMAKAFAEPLTCVISC